jgi:predicted SAM-dependent methyltransferase
MIYDKIYIGDALNIVPTLDKKYDLILLVDILEHFDYDDGIRLLKMCEQQASNTIISTPDIFLVNWKCLVILMTFINFCIKRIISR